MFVYVCYIIIEENIYSRYIYYYIDAIYEIKPVLTYRKRLKNYV